MNNNNYEWNNQNENKAEPSAPQTESYEVKGAEHSISYAPQKETKKKGKNSVKTVAALCTACVNLSGVFGFGGATLAARLNGTDTATAAATTQTSSGSAISVKQVSALTSVDAVTTSTSGENLSYAEAAALVKDSVVEIQTENAVRTAWFQYTTKGAGSGVILSENGYIVTNAHVILNESTEQAADSVTVRLTDGTEYKAEVISYDADEDIAVLKIDAEGLTAARVGNSDSLVVGEEILVVGNPLGKLGGTVSNGIVSATEREIQVEGSKMTLVQTNAAINPGNSGGGMFNLRGELVGIVNAKSSGTGIEGIGFAIPVNQAISIAEQLLDAGYVGGRPMIGVVLENVASQNGDAAEVIIRALSEGMNDGVLALGDKIVAVNGTEVSSYTDVKAFVSAASVGDKLTFTVERDGKVLDVTVTVYERTPEAMDALEKASEALDSEEDTPAEQQPQEQQQQQPQQPQQPQEGTNPPSDSADSEDFFSDFFKDFFGQFGGNGNGNENGGNGQQPQQQPDLSQQPQQPQDGATPPSGFTPGEIPESLADLFGNR